MIMLNCITQYHIVKSTIMIIIILIIILLALYHGHLDHCQHCFWGWGSSRGGLGEWTCRCIIRAYSAFSLHTLLHTIVQIQYGIKMQIQTTTEIQKLNNKYRYSGAIIRAYSALSLNTLLRHDCANTI